MYGEIKEFKRGVGVLIKELNVDVVPVYIRGTQNAWPAGKAFPRFAKVEVIFGEKISVEELTANQPAETDTYQNIANNLRQKLINLRNAYEV
jgi:1-acyl-sn-glycerol-3-phosphate acyltransferase